MNDHIALIKQRLQEQEDRLDKADREATAWNAEAYFALIAIGDIRHELFLAQKTQEGIE